MGDGLTVADLAAASLIEEDNFAAEADRLLDESVRKRSEHVLRRADIFATLAVALEIRELRLAIEDISDGLAGRS